MTTKAKTFYFIAVPEPYTFQVGVDAKTKEAIMHEWGLSDLVTVLADNDKRFNQTAAQLRMANRLVSLFEDCKPGSVVQVHPADYAELFEAAEKPSGGMPQLSGTNDAGQTITLRLGRKIQHIIDAIADATQTDPTESAESEYDDTAKPKDDVVNEAVESAPAH